MSEDPKPPKPPTPQPPPPKPMTKEDRGNQAATTSQVKKKTG